MSPDRLDVHVKKGWQDRLSITSVGSCQGLWALIMDSNPGFMSQVPFCQPPCQRPPGMLATVDASQSSGTRSRV